MKKYELLKDDTKIWCGTTLYRIKALRDFGSVEKGDLGGYIEKEENLSHDNNAWVSGNAVVSGNAWVYDNARVSGNAQVYGDALVSGNAVVSGNAWVYDNARVSGNAWVCGDTKATCQVLNLNYFDYNITLTDDHIQIGCKQFTYEIAIKLSKKDCGTLFTSDEFQQMWQYKKLLLELIKVKRPDLFKKEGK